MKAIIAGAGIGGLTAALCLKQFGWDVAVYEQAGAISEVGAGLQISPNAMKVFEALGIASYLERTAFEPEAIELRMGQSGLSLMRAPLGVTARTRWGSPYWHLHRADLVAALQAALQDRTAGFAVNLNHVLQGYTQAHDGVEVRFTNGQTARGDVLIAADGLHSAVRAQMHGPDRPTYTGHTAWRSVVPMERLGADAPHPVAGAWMGRGKHAVTYRIRSGTLANFVGVVERPEPSSESWTQEGSRAAALADFSGWHPTIVRMIERSDALYRWALFERSPLPFWTQGRVALLGDAAHPMLPFMAQGAAMAIEDAWALAASLSAGSVERGLERYQALRLPRTSRVQAASRANATRFHQRSDVGRLATYGPIWLAGRLAPRIGLAQQDWVYGYNIVRETAGLGSAAHG